jgi:alpha-tubulin suppressor-like RCC1 family protein
MAVHDSQDLPRRIADLEGRDAYAVLGVGPTAHDEEITAAYRREMARAHPDLGGSSDRAQLVNCAFDVLTRYRDSYDELVAGYTRSEDVAGPEVIFVEPDADPAEDPPAPARWRPPLRRTLAALALLAAVGLSAVAVRNAQEPEPVTAQGGWTADEAQPLASPTGSDAPDPVPTPRAATGSRAATAVVASGSTKGHRCEIRGDGSLWCSGGNARGQLGIGSTSPAPAPVRVVAVPGAWTAVVVAGTTTCALHSEGTLWCWGDNAFGQVGDGTNSLRAQPVPVQASQRWLAVDLDAHACAVRADHTLWCWGAGRQGQLGDGGVTGRATPVQLGHETTWAAVTVGTGWTCAVRQDGSEACWGGRRRR